MPKLLLATNNEGKAREYRSLLEGVPFELVTPAEVGISTEVAEVGKSFEENARLKATTLAAESGLLSLADDSGLEVEALGGEPGTLSARYAGEGASDE
ncbi:MAG: non-canonical purine NTP pyrophosphatase, partial [Dehalococcoidia bacterium]|nr:non-canonical purine NTP pyrophosphatase [Dehalococcoidia bacterium]